MHQREHGGAADFRNLCAKWTVHGVQCGLRVVVTSRERLRIAGEHEYGVPPLDIEGGVQLFLDRARLVRPDAVRDDADLGDALDRARELIAAALA